MTEVPHAQLHPAAQDLFVTILKRPLVKMLRDWREESQDRTEIVLLNDILHEINNGEFDG